MDALSHALIAYTLVSAPPLAPVAPFFILGSVLPDIDILYSPVSDHSPSLYLFTHGGIAHSLAGAVTIALITYGCVLGLSAAAVIPSAMVSGAAAHAPFALIAGTLLHLATDLPAIPGIPLLAPFSDRKYSLRVFPGPSTLLALSALVTVAVTMAGFLPFSSAVALFGAAVLGYLAVRTMFFLLAGARLPGRKIPSVNPLRWLVMRDDGVWLRVRFFTFFRGYGDEEVFEKHRNTDSLEVAAAAGRPDVRRFRFHSYSIIAERIGAVLFLADPVREKGYLWYPPKYRRVAVSTEGPG